MGEACVAIFWPNPGFKILLVSWLMLWAHSTIQVYIGLFVICWSLLWLYAILRSRAGSLRLHVILHEWPAFHSAFWSHRNGILTSLAWLVPHETAAVSAQVLCTPYNHALYHFMQSHIHKVHACLAVTCHLRLWQNDRVFLFFVLFCFYVLLR